MKRSLNRRLSALAIALPFALAAGASGATWFVDDDASGLNNGTSWANAFTNLQSAITAAQAGDEIWVAAGEYKPTGTLDRTITFQLKLGVTMRGGFEGDETSPGQRPADSDPTAADPAEDSILSGDIGAPGFGDNSYHVVTGTGTNVFTVLERFAVGNGEATATLGGGLYNSPGSPTVRDCLFFNNRSDFGGSAVFNELSSFVVLNNCVFRDNQALGNGRGGAISNFNGPSGNIVGCTFINNFANSGGGAILNSNATLTIDDCLFDNNVGNSNDGGAVWSIFSSILFRECTFKNNRTNTSLGSATAGGVSATGGLCTIEDSVFDGNVGWQGGGLTAWLGCSLVVRDTLFTNNNGAISGAGIHIIHDNAFAQIENCTFTNNTTAAGFGQGAGVYINHFNTNVFNCSFTGNNASRGGAMFINASATVRDCIITGNSVTNGQGAGIFVNNGSPTIVNCAIVSNNAIGSGGGAVVGGGSPKFINCLIAGNTSSVLGGGVLVNNGQFPAAPQFINCTVANNNADSFGGGFGIFSGNTTLSGCIVRGNTAFFDAQFRFVGGTLGIAYSNIQGGFVGTGNIDADPLFLNPADADGADNNLGTSDDGFTLTPGSPCLDAASNPALDAALPAGVVVELSGFSRFRDDPAAADTGLLSAMNPGIADMGAYERQPPPVCPGDADGDGSVGLGDVAELIQHWDFTVTPGTDGDLDFNGTVNLADLAIVIINWTRVCD